MNKTSHFIKYLLLFVSLAFVFVMLALPLVVVLIKSLEEGWLAYELTITDYYTQKALGLTLMTTIIVTVLNTIFGLFAAWAITKFNFRFKNALTTIIDLPFAISPIIAGLIFIMTFGRIGFLHPFLQAHHIKIVFAMPGIVLATLFVTSPFVAREIIPLMNSQGNEEEEAAAMMGANGFTIFFKVTLPKIKWALIYGTILCAARAMGEFGAVSVVSGSIRGKTNTLPLHVEILYNEFRATEAFGVASILVIMAIVILILRNVIEYKGRRGSE